MAQERDDEQVEGKVSPGRTEGGRRPIGVPPGEAGVGALGPGQRWTAARKRGHDQNSEKQAEILVWQP